MPKAEENSTALVVSDARLTKKNQLASFQKKTAKQIALIQRNEKDNVTRRLFVGLALHVIKESLDHGEWTPWTEKHVLPVTSQRQMHYMMAAAAVWIQKTGLNKPEVAALPGGNFSLKLKDGPGRKLTAAAVDFVGDRTWGELLAEEEIKEGEISLGGARARKGAKVRVQSAEQLYLFAREELGSLVEAAERVIVKENLLQHMTEHPEEALAAIESLEATLKKAKETARELLKK